MGLSVKLVVDERHKLVEGFAVAAVPTFKKLRDAFGGLFRHLLRRVFGAATRKLVRTRMETVRHEVALCYQGEWRRLILTLSATRVNRTPLPARLKLYAGPCGSFGTESAYMNRSRIALKIARLFATTRGFKVQTELVEVIGTAWKTVRQSHPPRL